MAVVLAPRLAASSRRCPSTGDILLLLVSIYTTTMTKLTFNEASHKYYFNGVLVPRSVSAVVKGLFPPFNPPVIIEKHYPNWKVNRTSRYNGMIQYMELVSKMTEPQIKQAIATLWRVHGLERARYGTKVHREVEVFIKTGTEPAVPTPELSAFKCWLHEHPHLEIVHSELMVYDSEYDVAGTIDLVIRDTVSGDYKVLDIKTCQAIDLQSEYGEKGLGPLQDLDSCNHVQYSAQIALYRHLLTVSTGIQATGGHILHLHSTSYAEYCCPDLQDRVHDMMTYS